MERVILPSVIMLNVTESLDKYLSLNVNAMYDFTLKGISLNSIEPSVMCLLQGVILQCVIMLNVSASLDKYSPFQCKCDE